MGSDVRQRRAERVKRQRLQLWAPRYGRYVVIALVVVVAAAAAATFLQPSTGDRFAHDHATFAMFVGGERVGFAHPDYDASRRGHGPPHMHVGDGKEVWHLEGTFPGGKPDLTLERTFSYMAVAFRDGYAKLDTLGGHNGTEWRDQGSATWQVFVSRLVGDDRTPFERIAASASQYKPQNMDRLLVTYGDLPPEELARQQAAVPAPPGEGEA